jgi:hypothetical protein
MHLKQSGYLQNDTREKNQTRKVKTLKPVTKEKRSIQQKKKKKKKLRKSVTTDHQNRHATVQSQTQIGNKEPRTKITWQKRAGGDGGSPLHLIT